MKFFQFECCGVDKYYDWYNINAWPNEERVPDSCCIRYERYCGRLDIERRNQDKWYQNGCSTAIQTWIVTRLHVIGWASLGIGSIQLFGLIASMILFCTVRHKRTTHAYKSYDTTVN